MAIDEKELVKIKNEIAKQYIAIFPEVKKTVRNKLIVHITEESTEYVQIAEDFLGNAAESLFAGFEARPALQNDVDVFEGAKTVKSQSEMDERQLRLYELSLQDDDYLAKYLHTAVINQCNVRLKRWSHDKNG